LITRCNRAIVELCKAYIGNQYFLTMGNDGVN
jgi:hypothetical protein